MISVGIYSDKDKNVIVNSSREDENGILRSLKQYTYLGNGWTKEELADAIMNNFEADVQREQELIEEPDFWTRATGIKGFSAFSRRHNCVDIDYIDCKDCYRITAEKRYKDGSYGLEREDIPIRTKTYPGYPKRESIADEVLEAMKIDEDRILK